MIEAQASSLPCFISDYIPNEAVITNIVHAISLKNNAKFWASEINKYRIEKRINRSKKIIKNGYDIKDTVKHLLKIYSSADSF